jgi:hypothetical protein
VGFAKSRCWQLRFASAACRCGLQLQFAAAVAPSSSQLTILRMRLGPVVRLQASLKASRKLSALHPRSARIVSRTPQMSS